MVTFGDLGVSGILLDRLTYNGFTEPTEIQQKTIPFGLQHRDVIGSAQTGTGKTLAFLVPVLNNIINSNNGIALIIEPTRELAQQVIRIANRVVTRGIFNILLIGGESYDRQIQGLKRNPRIIIGTPGRIIDHIGRKTLRLDSCHSLVLDETDRMFDMGFRIQLEKIFDKLPEERQTFMFSATFPKGIEQMAIQRLHDPAKVFVQPNESANKVADNLVQETVKLSENEKYGELIRQIEKRDGSIIVFVKTKLSTERLSSRLFRDGYSACAIHGDLRQRQRERIISMFRNGKYKILIGTDIIARGLDIPHVMHVINYDIPYVPEDYVHRIGRTARHGANGYAVSFVTPEDNKYWDDIQCMLDPSKKKQSQDRSSDTHSHNRNHHRSWHLRGRRPTNGALWKNDNRNSRSHYHRREG